MHETLSWAPALSRTLDYAFRDPSLLQAALIHTSYVNERPGRGLESNERLEFLGDAVLGVVVAHRLYELRPESAEGELTVLRAWLVRQSTLARWARQLAICSCWWATPGRRPPPCSDASAWSWPSVPG